MSRLQELHPDQAAVLQLVLRRRMDYDDLAGALGLQPHGVRERALDAVDGLAPDDVAGLGEADRDRIADLLLGQGPEADRAATRELLRTTPAAHGWATTVADELAPLGGPREPVPPLAAAPEAGAGLAPEAEAEPDAAVAGGLGAAVAGGPDGAVDAGTDADAADAGTDADASEAEPDAETADGPADGAAGETDHETGDVREAFAALGAGGSSKGPGSGRPRSSRGLVGLGVVGLVIAALVVAWVSGAFDGGESSESAAAPPTSTATTGAEEDAAAAQAFLAALPKQINFNPPSGASGAFAQARGVAQSMLSQSTGAPVLALVTENLPKATANRRYFAWADKLGQDPILLGQLTDARGAELPFVGADVETRQEVAVDPTVYNRIRITRSGPGKTAPRKPGPTVMVGTLTLRATD